MRAEAAELGAVGRTHRISLPALAAASLMLVTAALVLAFFVAPNDAFLGFSQKIFYFHVSIAFTAYLAFGLGAWKGLVHLWKRDPNADLESYVAIHQGVIFGVLVLVTGSIWAKYSWGHWWLWSENQLVLFLVLFLFYAAYFMLRFSRTTIIAFDFREAKSPDMGHDATHEFVALRIGHHPIKKIAFDGAGNAR